MMYVLSFQRSGTQRDPFVARTSVVTIGRSEFCDLQLRENGISERHATIELQADGFHIQSAADGGTLQVNNTPTTDARLASGDEIEIGSVSIRFDIAHDLGEKHQQRSLLTYAMMVIIIISILGQVGVIAWIYSTPHPKTEISTIPIPKRQEIPPPLERIQQRESTVSSTSATSSPSMGGTTTREPPAQRKQAERSTLQVLNRMIRILGVRRADQTKDVTLTIRLKAQVAQRHLNTSEVAVSVQIFQKNMNENEVTPFETQWLDVTGWQNFSTRSFTTQWLIPTHEFAGYVIRTYYRNQLQDVATSSQELLKAAPDLLQN